MTGPWFCRELVHVQRNETIQPARLSLCGFSPLSPLSSLHHLSTTAHFYLFICTMSLRLHLLPPPQSVCVQTITLCLPPPPTRPAFPPWFAPDLLQSTEAVGWLAWRRIGAPPADTLAEIFPGKTSISRGGQSR